MEQISKLLYDTIEKSYYKTLHKELSSEIDMHLWTYLVDDLDRRLDQQLVATMLPLRNKTYSDIKKEWK